MEQLVLLVAWSGGTERTPLILIQVHGAPGWSSKLSRDVLRRSVTLTVVKTLPCGHVAHLGSSRICRHLVDPAARNAGHVRLLTGHGMRYNVCCAVCDKALRAGEPVQLVDACEGCVASYADEEHGSLIAWRGEPGIAERPEPVDPTIAETPLPASLGPILDIAPVTDQGRSTWVLLAAGGQIAQLDAATATVTPLAVSSVPTEPDHEPWNGHELRPRLHVSPDGRFAAVLNDYGHHGQVIDLRTGSVTLKLNGGDYYPTTVPFSFAFAINAGRTVVVHRTAWNRLDVSDAVTGHLLVARESPSYRAGQPRPDHDLDYFHGALYPSPDGRWLADDGWVWHPVGVPSVWDMRRWLAENRWESEDGPTLKYLCHRAYHWDVPMCWIGDGLLAISGIGNDDEAMLDGVRIFDVATGAELNTFAGPRGALFAAGRRLYAAAPDGLGIWDPFTGHRTGTVPGFVPTSHHPGTGELAAVNDGRLLRWRTPRGPVAEAALSSR
jgi:hypothetical protein